MIRRWLKWKEIKTRESKFEGKVIVLKKQVTHYTVLDIQKMDFSSIYPDCYARWQNIITSFFSESLKKAILLVGLHIIKETW